MSRRGEEFTCRCGRTSHDAWVVRGTRFCQECAMAEMDRTVGLIERKPNVRPVFTVRRVS